MVLRKGKIDFTIMEEGEVLKVVDFIKDYVKEVLIIFFRKRLVFV